MFLLIHSQDVLAIHGAVCITKHDMCNVRISQNIIRQNVRTMNTFGINRVSYFILTILLLRPTVLGEQ